MPRLHVMPVVGARPNFMKMAPLVRAFERHADRVEFTLVHTGQHYDEAMSDAFFRQLGIPEPAINLGVGSGTHAEQVGRTMMAFEKVLVERRPDWVLVVGDVNATCACAITARKEGARLAHVEAGLRSFDLSMPEEINRLVTDRLADLLLTTDALADRHLLDEGTPPGRIRCVGNVMIDTLEAQRAAAAAHDLRGVAGGCLADLRPGAYAVLTLHRPSNVDDEAVLRPLVDFLAGELSRAQPLVWPVHPRARQRLEAFGLWDKVRGAPGIRLAPPLDYLTMLRLTMEAAVMLTDSGGLQEECCVLGTPCLTLRANTERPVTLLEQGGTSVLVGNDVARLRAAWEAARHRPRRPHRPPLWDGHAAERVVAALLDAAAVRSHQ